MEGFRAFAAQTCEQALTSAVTVNIGGVEEIDAEIQGGMQCGHRFFVVDFAPFGTDGPGAKTDFRYFPTGTAKCSIVHW